MIQHLLAIWSVSSAFSKSSLYVWKFSIHVLMKPSLKDFELYKNIYHYTWPKELIIQSEEFPQIHSERSIRIIPEHSEAGCNMFISFFFFFWMNLCKSQQIGRDICDSLNVENDWLSYEKRAPRERRGTWRNFKPGNRKRPHTTVGTFLNRRKSDRRRKITWGSS